MEAQRAKEYFSSFVSKAIAVNDSKVLILKIDEFAPAGIKTGVELLSSKLGKSVIVICSMKKDGTVFVTAKVSDELIKSIQAGKLVGEITKALNGNGGGKPQMAQGMGKTQEGIDNILSKVQNDVVEALK